MKTIDREMLEMITEKLSRFPVNTLKMSLDMKVQHGGLMIIDGDSFQEFCPKYLPKWFNELGRDEMRVEGNVTANWSSVRQPHMLRIYNSDNMSKGMFTKEVFLPTMKLDGDTWMSITPAELLSQMDGAKHAKGHVLVGGLGMGWFARVLLDNPDVTKVTVVEQNETVIKLFGDELTETYASDRFEIVNDDAYHHGHENWHDYDSIIYDIWLGYGDAMSDRDWKGLKNLIKSFRPEFPIWGWGDNTDWQMAIGYAMTEFDMDIREDERLKEKYCES